jgi:hypothetical protein
MSTSLQLGSEIERDGQTWRVVRLVIQEHSLFEDENGVYIVTETHAQLKGAEGQVDFMVLSSEKFPYEGPASTIKALAPIPWRRQ